MDLLPRQIAEGRPSERFRAPRASSHATGEVVGADQPLPLGEQVRAVGRAGPSALRCEQAKPSVMGDQAHQDHPARDNFALMPIERRMLGHRMTAQMAGSAVGKRARCRQGRYRPSRWPLRARRILGWQSCSATAISCPAHKPHPASQAVERRPPAQAPRPAGGRLALRSSSRAKDWDYGQPSKRKQSDLSRP
jgi:hypothetical protein